MYFMMLLLIIQDKPYIQHFNIYDWSQKVDFIIYFVLNHILVLVT